MQLLISNFFRFVNKQRYSSTLGHPPLFTFFGNIFCQPKIYEPYLKKLLSMFVKEERLTLLWMICTKVTVMAKILIIIKLCFSFKIMYVNITKIMVQVHTAFFSYIGSVAKYACFMRCNRVHFSWKGSDNYERLSGWAMKITHHS